MPRSAFVTAATVYDSEANGTAKVHVLTQGLLSAVRLRFVLPLTARTADANISVQTQHAPTPTGPWLNYAGVLINDTSDNVALLSGVLDTRGTGVLLPYVRFTVTVTDRTGPNNLVSFTAIPLLSWETPTVGSTLQRPVNAVVLASAGDGLPLATNYIIGSEFDSAQLRCALNVIARDANTDLVVQLQHAASDAGPWADVGSALINDVSDATGLFTGYVDEAAVGPILPFTRFAISCADRGAAALRNATVTAYAIMGGQSNIELSVTELATTGATVDGETVPAGVHQNLGTPLADSATVVHAAYAGNDADPNFPAGFTDPDVPRNATVTFNALWDGGDVEVFGTNQYDIAISEIVTSNPGGTSGTTRAFKTVTAATKTLAGASATGASIGVGGVFGVGSTTGPDRPLVNVGGSGFGAGVLTVDGVSEAATYGGQRSTVAPTTAANGARRFIVFYAATLEHDHTLTEGSGHQHSG